MVATNKSLWLELDAATTGLEVALDGESGRLASLKSSQKSQEDTLTAENQPVMQTIL